MIELTIGQQVRLGKGTALWEITDLFTWPTDPDGPKQASLTKVGSKGYINTSTPVTRLTAVRS